MRNGGLPMSGYRHASGPGDPARFPRRRLSLSWTRRHVLSSLVTEVRAGLDAAAGGTIVKLADLGTMPDEILELQRPLLVGVATAERSPVLRPGASRLVAARFDGRATLGEIAHQVACELAWDEAYAFAYVRGVFLQLVSTGLCLPR